MRLPPELARRRDAILREAERLVLEGGTLEEFEALNDATTLFLRDVLLVIGVPRGEFRPELRRYDA